MTNQTSTQTEHVHNYVPGFFRFYGEPGSMVQCTECGNRVCAYAVS